MGLLCLFASTLLAVYIKQKTAGTGYIVGNALVFTGGEGSGAVATVSSVSSGGITGISLTSAGSGYTSAPTISVTSTAGTGAVITCALVGASVTGITIIHGGKNDATAPTFVFTAVSGEVEHQQRQH